MPSDKKILATAATQSLFCVRPLSEAAVVVLVVAWVLPLARATDRITGNSGEAATGLIVAAGIGWRLWRDWPEKIAPRPAAVAGLALWGAMAWLSAGVWPEDYWLVRAALPLAAVLLIVLAWGWRGLGVGWRVWAIALLWVLAPLSGRWLEGPRGGDWLCETTAAAAGAGLRLFGFEVGREGALLKTAGGAVLVGLPCTAQPLTALMLRLLLPAALALGLSWRRTVLVAALTLPAAFLLSVGRAMLLALVVDDDARFHYWHGPDGSGWFTLAAMLALAAGVLALLPRVAADATPRTRGLPGWSIAAALAGAVMAVACLFRVPATGAMAAAPTAAAVAAGWTVEEIARPAVGWKEASPPPVWVREFVYTATADGAQVRVLVAALPRWLNGDPLALAVTLGWTPRPSPDDGEEFFPLPDGGGHGASGECGPRATVAGGGGRGGREGDGDGGWVAGAGERPSVGFCALARVVAG